MQTGLFDNLADGDDPPCQRHSETSQAAAEQVRPERNRLRQQVLDLLRQCGERGATDEEMQEALAMNPSTQRPRRVELVQRRLVHDSGRRRLTRSRRQAVVWTVLAVGVQPPRAFTDPTEKQQEDW